MLFRDAGAEFTRHAERRVWSEGHHVEQAQAHADVDGVAVGSDAGDDVAQNAGAVLERATELARTAVGAEEFVQEVAVAVLDVDEVGAAVTGHAGGLHVAADQLLDVGIGQDLIVGGDVELLVEDGVAVGHAGFPALLVMRTAEPAGVGELEADDQVVDRTPASEVLGLEDADEFGDASLVLLIDDQLVHVRATIGAHGHGLGTADQLRTARAEALPASLHLLGDAASRGAVPAFHRVDGDTVTDGLAVDLRAADWLREGITSTGFNGVLERQVGSDAGAMGAEISDSLERRDAGKFKWGGHRLSGGLRSAERCRRGYRGRTPDAWPSADGCHRNQSNPEASGTSRRSVYMRGQGGGRLGSRDTEGGR